MGDCPLFVELARLTVFVTVVVDDWVAPPSDVSRTVPMQLRIMWTKPKNTHKPPTTSSKEKSEVLKQPRPTYTLDLRSGGGGGGRGVSS